MLKVKSENKLRELSELKDDWNGFNSREPTSKVLKGARKFLDHYEDQISTSIDICPINDGAIQIECKNGDKYLEITFEDENSGTYLAENSGKIDVEEFKGITSIENLIQWLKK